MRDEAVEDCLAALTFISDWFVTSKILEKFVNMLSTLMIYSLIVKIKSYLLLITGIFFM